MHPLTNSLSHLSFIPSFYLITIYSYFLYYYEIPSSLQINETSPPFYSVLYLVGCNLAGWKAILLRLLKKLYCYWKIWETNNCNGLYLVIIYCKCSSYYTYYNYYSINNESDRPWWPKGWESLHTEGSLHNVQWRWVNPTCLQCWEVTSRKGQLHQLMSQLTQKYMSVKVQMTYQCPVYM